VALLALLEALARATNEAASPEAAMRTCLERISEYARWDFGRVAILKTHSGVPVVESSIWLTADKERYGDFMRVSESYDYSQLSGRFVSLVLREKQPGWIEDFGKTKPRGRLRNAMKAGLRSGFAFPIIVQGEVAAFLEFFATEPRKADPLLLDAVGSVGAQLARLIERARAEAVRARLAAVVEGSHDAIFSRALDGTVLSWNAGAERMFGYASAEMIGRPISIIAPPELVHESQRNTAALLRGEPAPPFETVRVAKDGRAVQVQVTVSPIRGTSGEVTAIAAFMRDVTARKRTEDDRAQLAAVVEHSQDAIISTAPDRTIRTWNAGAERIFGYTAAEAMGRNVLFIVPDDLQHELAQRRALALDGQSAPPHDTERLTKDGRRIPVSISASPLRDGAGNVSGVALIYRDISELKRAQRELEQKAALSHLMESLARATNEAASAEAGMYACLEQICEHGAWSIGRLGVYGPGEGERFPERSLWHTKEPGRYETLISASRDPKYFAPGGQLISVVLKEKRPVWIGDISSTSGFGRMSIALECKLRSAFAFPVIVGGEVAAFIEFFAEEAREPDALLLEAVTSVGAQLARLIERTNAERIRAQLAAIVENSDDAILSRNLERTILTWNAAAGRLFGWSAEEAIGNSISIIVPPERLGENARYREMVHRGEPVPMYDTERLTKDGRRIPVSMSQSPIKDADGRITGVSLIFRDITERKEAEEKIRHLAHYDGLTGLPNRELFYDRLGQTIAYARRDQHAVGLLYLDLDGFKAVNDAFGHDAGDDLLKAIAERMRWCLRESDTIARVGGDEFVVILPKDPRREDCVVVAEKLLEVFSTPFLLDRAQREAVVRASIGVAAFPSDAEDTETLIKAADSAMYYAKQAGNRYRFYDEVPRP